MKRLILLPFLLLQAAACDDDRSTGPAPTPTAAFTVSGTLQAGQPARFDAAASADPGGGGLSYTWAFGDGAHGGTREIAHLYAQGGAFAVQLTVRDAQDRTATATQTVTIAPGPAATGTATLAGRVTLPDGTPLAGVAVAVAGTSVTAQTAADGSVTLPPVPAGVPLALRLARAGYADGSVRVEALANGSSYGWFQAALASRTPAGVLASAQAGGTVAGPAGAQVVFPAAGLVRADGTPATGAVDVAITPVDVVNAVDAFPGPFSGIQANGTSTPIASFGVMEVALSQGGQPVQVAPGRSATIEIPVFTGGASAGETIPLWSLDEASGLWIQEGTGTIVANAASPTGLAMRGTVSHLSWWNIDVPYGPHVVNVKCFTLSGTTLVALAVPCYVQAKQEGVGNPITLGNAVIPGGSRLPLPIFPGVPTRIYARQQSAASADVLVSGGAGTSQNVDVVVPAPATPPNPPGTVQMVAVAFASPALAAYNGTSWTTAQSSLNGGSVNAVAWDGTRWVAGSAGSNPGLATSTDGFTWTAGTFTNPGVLASVRAVAGNGTRWVAAGGTAAGGSAVATSTDGQTWTAQTLPPTSLARAVAWNGTYWLLLHENGASFTSTDGISWIARPPAFAPNVQTLLNAVAWNGTLWLAVADQNGVGRVFLSPNATNWAEPSPIGAPSLFSIAWNGVLWAAGGSGVVMTSSDAVNWVPHTVPLMSVRGIAWTGAEWVGVGMPNVAIRSSSATSWTTEPLPFSNLVLGVAYRRPLYPPWP